METVIANEPISQAEIVPLAPREISPLAMLDRAIERGMAPDQMGKLIELVEKMKRMADEERFGVAVAAFQAEMPQIKKDRETQKSEKGFGFKYASLNDIMTAAQPLLGKHGIAVSFDSEQVVSDKGICTLNVTCRLRVGSYFEDRSFKTPIPTDLKASDPQKFGAALAYGKRYCFSGALNIQTTDQDTDANDVYQYLDDQQEMQILDLLAEYAECQKRDIVEVTKSFCKWAKIKSVKHIHAQKFEEAATNLRKEIEKVKRNGGAK